MQIINKCFSQFQSYLPCLHKTQQTSRGKKSFNRWWRKKIVKSLRSKKPVKSQKWSPQIEPWGVNWFSSDVLPSGLPPYSLPFQVSVTSVVEIKVRKFQKIFFLFNYFKKPMKCIPNFCPSLLKVLYEKNVLKTLIIIIKYF